MSVKVPILKSGHALLSACSLAQCACRVWAWSEHLSLPIWLALHSRSSTHTLRACTWWSFVPQSISDYRGNALAYLPSVWLWGCQILCRFQPSTYCCLGTLHGLSACPLQSCNAVSVSLAIQPPTWGWSHESLWLSYTFRLPSVHTPYSSCAWQRLQLSYGHSLHLSLVDAIVGCR